MIAVIIRSATSKKIILIDTNWFLLIQWAFEGEPNQSQTNQTKYENCAPVNNFSLIGTKLSLNSESQAEVRRDEVSITTSLVRSCRILLNG